MNDKRTHPTLTRARSILTGFWDSCVEARRLQEEFRRKYPGMRL